MVFCKPPIYRLNLSRYTNSQLGNLSRRLIFHGPIIRTTWAITGLFFFICLFSTVNSVHIPICSNFNFETDWIQTSDLWNQERPLCQLSHNHWQSHRMSPDSNYYLKSSKKNTKMRIIFLSYIFSSFKYYTIGSARSPMEIDPNHGSLESIPTKQPNVPSPKLWPFCLYVMAFRIQNGPVDNPINVL